MKSPFPPLSTFDFHKMSTFDFAGTQIEPMLDNMYLIGYFAHDLDNYDASGLANEGMTLKVVSRTRQLTDVKEDLTAAGIQLIESSMSGEDANTVEVCDHAMAVILCFARKLIPLRIAKTCRTE
jgi:hypothetical protein